MSVEVSKAVATPAIDVKVGERILVFRAAVGSELRRAPRSMEHPQVATVTDKEQSSIATILGTTEGPLYLGTRSHVLVLPPAQDDEADTRLRHGIELLRHGAALVAPEVEWLPVDSDRGRALNHTLASIEALVREFEDAYDLPSIRTQET